MGHRAAITMATLSAQRLTPRLTRAVAHVNHGSSDQNSLTGKDFCQTGGARLTGRWVASQVASWVATWVASKRGATPRVAVAPDPAPGGAGSRQGVAPLLLAGQVVRCGEAHTMARAVIERVPRAGHHAGDCWAALGCRQGAAPRAARWRGCGLDRTLGAARIGNCVMATGMMTDRSNRDRDRGAVKTKVGSRRELTTESVGVPNRARTMV